MQKNYVKFILILLFTTLFTQNSVMSQTGIYYYPLSNSEFPNSRVSDMLQLSSNRLLLLNKCSDETYKYARILVQQVNLSGELQNSWNIDEENLYDLVKLEKISDQSCKIYGNTTLNESFAPFNIEISNDGKTGNKSLESSAFSTHLKDIKLLDNQQALMLFTKAGKNEKYNISLHKISLVDNKLIWLKKISSEMNEEADEISIGNIGEILILGKKYNEEVTDYVPVIYKLDSNGEQMWKRGIEVPGNFYSQSMCVTKTGEIIYACGYTKNPTGISETKIIKLSKDGDEVGNSTISDFSSNGTLLLANGTVLLYGSKFLVNDKQVVTKGRFAIITDDLNELVNDYLTPKDKPDADLNQKLTTSSDFLTAIQLTDGRIAIGGKVYMPMTTSPKDYRNNSLLLIMNNNGTFR